MADPFLAEIRIFAGNFAPKGWALCNGQLLPISQNTALFSLLGTFYGGDGKSTFGLPDLQRRAPMHQGQGAGLNPRDIGEQGGEETVTLLESEMPNHNHSAMASTGAPSSGSPVGNVWSTLGTTRTPPPLYSDTSNTTMGPKALNTSGSSFPHNNMSPYLVLNFIIAMQGIFPSRS